HRGRVATRAPTHAQVEDPPGGRHRREPALRRLGDDRRRPARRRRHPRARAGDDRRRRQRRPPRDLRHRGRAGLGRPVPQRRGGPPRPPRRPGDRHLLRRLRRGRAGPPRAPDRPRRHGQPPDRRGDGRAARPAAAGAAAAPLRRGPVELSGGPLDLLVLGSGVAGLSAAVRAADVHGLRVGVLTKGELDQATTRWAQGGVAAVLGGDPDSTDLHLADTLAAGAGLCDEDAVRVLVEEGPGRVNELIALGAIFDRDAAGELLLAREGGHSHARVVHAGGAATGVEVERALVAAVRETAAVLLEHWFALDLLVEGGRCAGVVAMPPGGGRAEVRARNVMVATGGAGQLYAVTTNPPESTGDGIAMALRAGVAVADLAFVQFHPTALHHPAMPRPLLSEALRGHGAVLRDPRGERFVDEMLPRDRVSGAVTAVLAEQGAEHVWLDATGLERFADRCPTIAAALAEAGLDPARAWLPVAPAAHYLCGGIVADLDGATTLPG